jgi:hypothetical protein
MNKVPSSRPAMESLSTYGYKLHFTHVYLSPILLPRI